MREFSFRVRQFVRKLDKKKFGISLFLALLAFTVTFFSLNLYKYYKNNVVTINDDRLFYTFKTNTFKNLTTNINTSTSLNEQFLSYNVSYGIDVSEWQGDIDWNRVAATGINFAIIRCGFREIDGSNVKEDAYFRKNVKEAREAGLNVGVYFFGTAKTQEEAREEAEFTISLVKDYDISYPIVYDAEVLNRGRLEGISASTVTDNILAFTDVIESYGYTSMIYSYSSALSYNFDTGRFDGKLLWVAYFGETLDYNGNYNMWQYSDAGRVDGVPGYVDLNVSYFTYVEKEEDIVNDPNYKKGPDLNYESVNEEVTTKSGAVLRSSATTDVPNKVVTLSYGTKLKRIGKSDTFSKILYNGKVVYILNKELN